MKSKDGWYHDLSKCEALWSEQVLKWLTTTLLEDCACLRKAETLPLSKARFSGAGPLAFSRAVALPTQLLCSRLHMLGAFTRSRRVSA